MTVCFHRCILQKDSRPSGDAPVSETNDKDNQDTTDRRRRRRKNFETELSLYTHISLYICSFYYKEFQMYIK